MTQSAQRLLKKHYGHRKHPYRQFEEAIDLALSDGVRTLLDAGCGRSAPVLGRYVGRVPRLIGVDVVNFRDPVPSIETYTADLANLPLEDGAVDLIISRSVFEHLVDPLSVYREFRRVLAPGGRVIFLTANMWDYATLIAKLVPNRLHARIVRYVEGRAEEDTFPTAYKTNTVRSIRSLCSQSGLELVHHRHLSQYPNYLLFSAPLFFVGMCFEKIIHRFESLRVLRGWLLVTLRKPAS